MGLSVHSAKEGHFIRGQGTGSCSHGSRLYFYGPHQCSFLCAISSSWTWTPRANPCHGQGGRCQVSRGHLSPADVHNQRHEHQCPLGLVVHRQEHWHLSSDGKKVPAASGGTWHQASRCDTTVVPGLGISQRLVNVDQICCMF